MRKRKPVFADIADFDEDARIDMIGKYVIENKKIAAFITDSDPGKSQRYVRKLLERFPGIEIISKSPGPVENTVTVKVGPKS